MRTTIELPDDLHSLVRRVAHATNRTMSEVVVELMCLGLLRRGADVGASDRGMPLVSVGRHITREDVRSLGDE